MPSGQEACDGNSFLSKGPLIIVAGVWLQRDLSPPYRVDGQIDEGSTRLQEVDQAKKGGKDADE